jgi:hypothetical protein
MKTSHILKTLAAAVTLLTGSQSAHALTPWTDGLPDLVVYTSGGAAQDQAYAVAVAKDLAAAGTLDTFEDEDAAGTVGGRFAGYYFKPGTALTALGIPANTKIFLEKRSLGAAGYGVVPLANNLALNQLSISKAASPTDSSNLAAWTANGAKKWKAVINAANAGKYLDNYRSHGGFIGVDAAALLKTGTQNYPTPVNEVSTGTPTAGWNLTTEIGTLEAKADRLPTGGLVYGVGVTKGLYDALQAAEYYAGYLPADTLSKLTAEIANPGSQPTLYSNEEYIPSLNRNFLAALLAGKIADWKDVKAPGAPGGTLVTAAAAAGLPALTETKVAVARRNTGAAIGAVAYAKILNYPTKEGNAVAPANPTVLSPLAVRNAAKPLINSPAGAKATDNQLTYWQNGTLDATLNPEAKKYWGIAVHSGDRNKSIAQPWRYIRIDGFAGTLENVASGDYPYWAEGEVIARKLTDLNNDSINALAPGINSDRRIVLETFADALGSVSTANQVNIPALTLPYGQSGIFATTKTDPSAVVQVPFVNTNPVIGLTHNSSDNRTHLDIAPVPFKNAASAANIIELKGN